MTQEDKHNGYINTSQYIIVETESLRKFLKKKNNTHLRKILEEWKNKFFENDFYYMPKHYLKGNAKNHCRVKYHTTYRIMFMVDEIQKIITITLIDHRKDCYDSNKRGKYLV